MFCKQGVSVVVSSWRFVGTVNLIKNKQNGISDSNLTIKDKVLESNNKLVININKYTIIKHN